MSFLRALALHASAPALRALLARDGEMLDAAADALWKGLRGLDVAGGGAGQQAVAGAAGGAARFGSASPEAPVYGTYAVDSFG